MMRKLLIAVLFVSSFAACDQTIEEQNSDADTTSYFEPSTLISDSGLFRNVSISSTLEEVKATEKVNPTNEQEGYLYYEYPLPNNNKYTLTYSFDDKGLYEIQADIFIADTNALASELKELQKPWQINLESQMKNKKPLPFGY